MYRNSLEILVGISPWQELTDAQHDYIHCEKHFVENSGYLTPSILAFHLPLFCFIFLFSIQAWPDGCGVGMRHLGMQVIASDQHLLNLAWTHRDIVNQTFVVVGILGSGMEMPLIALKKLFGGKAHLVKYLPLVSKTLNNSEFFLLWYYSTLFGLEKHVEPEEQLGKGQGCQTVSFWESWGPKAATWLQQYIVACMHAKLFKVKQQQSTCRIARSHRSSNDIFDVNSMELSKKVRLQCFVATIYSPYQHLKSKPIFQPIFSLAGSPLLRWIPMHPIFSTPCKQSIAWGRSSQAYVEMHPKHPGCTSSCLLSSMYNVIAAAFVWNTPACHQSQAGLLENVRGFAQVLDTVLEVLEYNLPEQHGCMDGLSCISSASVLMVK